MEIFLYIQRQNETLVCSMYSISSSFSFSLHLSLSLAFALSRSRFRFQLLYTPSFRFYKCKYTYDVIHIRITEKKNRTCTCTQHLETVVERDSVRMCAHRNKQTHTHTHTHTQICLFLSKQNVEFIFYTTKKNQVFFRYHLLNEIFLRNDFFSAQT